MSSIQFDNGYLEDPAWLGIGGDAFTLHVAACMYADRRNNDGVIPKAMLLHMGCLPLTPDQIPPAAAKLVQSGVWEESKKTFRIVHYGDQKIGLSAEEKLGNRARWAADKRIKRQHDKGNHADCNPRKCPAAKEVSKLDSHVESAKSPNGVQVLSHRSTRLDSTRPLGRGEEESRGAVPSPLDSAEAPSGAGTAERLKAGIEGMAGLQPDDLEAVVIASRDDSDHVEIWVETVDPSLADERRNPERRKALGASGKAMLADLRASMLGGHVWGECCTLQTSTNDLVVTVPKAAAPGLLPDLVDHLNKALAEA